LPRGEDREKRGAEKTLTKYEERYPSSLQERKKNQKAEEGGKKKRGQNSINEKKKKHPLYSGKKMDEVAKKQVEERGESSTLRRDASRHVAEGRESVPQYRGDPNPKKRSILKMSKKKHSAN